MKMFKIKEMVMKNQHWCRQNQTISQDQFTLDEVKSFVRAALSAAGWWWCRGPVLCRAALFWEHDVTTHPALRHAAAARLVLSCTQLVTNTR